MNSVRMQSAAGSLLLLLLIGSILDSYLGKSEAAAAAGVAPGGSTSQLRPQRGFRLGAGDRFAHGFGKRFDRFGSNPKAKDNNFEGNLNEIFANKGQPSSSMLALVKKYFERTGDRNDVISGRTKNTGSGSGGKNGSD